MNLIPVILDSQSPYGSEASLPTVALPLATGSVLDHLVLSLSSLDPGQIVVVRNSGEMNGCRRCTWPQTLSQVRTTSIAELEQTLSWAEPSDYLLILESRFWPTDGYDLGRLVEAAAAYTGATHFIPVGYEDSGPRERVECDADGRIRRVHRLYDTISWTGHTSTSPFCSLVPMRAVADLRFASLAELREHLLTRKVFSRDLPLRSSVWDLSRPADVLGLNEQTICKSLIRPKDAGFLEHSPGVLAWETCTIAPSVRLIPPVIVHPHARIEEEATLIGPVVVGCRAVVGRGAIVAKSVLTPAAVVPAAARIRHQVVLPNGQSADASQGMSQRPEVLQPLYVSNVDVTMPAWEPAVHGWRWRISQMIKRSLDIVLASAGLVVLSPLMLAVAIMIKLASPGSVFFGHRRECRQGREFLCLKFRTMVPKAHTLQRQLYEQNEVDGPQFKMDNDPRVTRIGRFLRRTNIDELPQLLNVLAGHMSLVGPRPSPFRENQICVPWRLARLSVRPGITGLWQICRDDRSDGDFHQWIYYDIMYVRHQSLWLDAKILFHTLVSLGGRKSVSLSSLIPAEKSQDSPMHGATQA